MGTHMSQTSQKEQSWSKHMALHGVIGAHDGLPIPYVGMDIDKSLLEWLLRKVALGLACNLNKWP